MMQKECEIKGTFIFEIMKQVENLDREFITYHQCARYRLFKTGRIKRNYI